MLVQMWLSLRWVSSYFVGERWAPERWSAEIRIISALCFPVLPFQKKLGAKCSLFSNRTFQGKVRWYTIWFDPTHPWEGVLQRMGMMSISGLGILLEKVHVAFASTSGCPLGWQQDQIRHGAERLRFPFESVGQGPSLLLAVPRPARQRFQPTLEKRQFQWLQLLAKEADQMEAY